MEMENKYASKGVAGSGLGLGIAGTALGLLNNGNGLGGLFGGNNNCGCSEDHYINRYEAGQSARIAELETEVKLRDSNIYTDNKILALYQYVDGKIQNVEGQICQQNVYNATNTATINCLSGQIAQLMNLTKLVIPNGSVCPGWGNVTVTPATTPTTTG
ncbi:MAG: hypothetical protein U0L72_03880 [Acutalibacteraceae bacterium]|nr:hypothetical protein [Acutalibacteraceae bacterium]